MKALILDAPNELKIVERNIPKPQSGEVLVKIKAMALNHRDQFIREGKYPGIKSGVILGADACGEIVELGNSVTKKWLEKKVLINPNINWGNNPLVQSKEYHIMGTPTDGVFAEYVSIATDRLAEKPDFLSDTEAAALPLGGMTAFRAVFHHGQLKEGQNVLISGVGGGVAQFAFQFALAIGANVFVTSGDASKREKAIKYGARNAYNYKDEEWTTQAKKEVGGFDLVIDSAGGDAINDHIKLMNPAGRIVFYGATLGKPKSLDVHRMFWNQITLQGSTMANDEEFLQMVQFVEEHKIKPIVDSITPFQNIVEAFDKIKAGAQFGKLVIEI
ncbi:zinc-binding dehydrogenase [Marivirga sp. S37H4]|uniref:Zinc-binding dehydrogenase n=1 Tax=Marivirga aurantiaca TaxID=2802615 RepID=A0A935C9B4_9BACT|nr:zinc-binding dehydrogenase [Marivirga aurantiaca]MBK6264163.1 zinc-binding dehydrogenase [Marivirga aurantiaca]